MCRSCAFQEGFLTFELSSCLDTGFLALRFLTPRQITRLYERAAAGRRHLERR